jgi:tetratricopeptide (TPR) repeat protein
MDCRTCGLWALGLSMTLGSFGCQHLFPSTNTATSKSAEPTVQTSFLQSTKKRKPQAATLVALAKVREDRAGEVKETEVQVKLRDEARELYQEAIKIDAKHLPGYLGLARVYTRLNDYDRAIEIFSKATKQFPKNGQVWHDLAMCHNSRKDWDKGIECLTNALELDPENRQHAQTLGLTLARAGRLEDSLAVLSKGYGEAHAHFTVARMLHHMNQLDSCKEQLRLALQADPDLRPAREMLTALEGPSAPTAQGTPAQGTPALRNAYPVSQASLELKTAQ